MGAFMAILFKILLGITLFIFISMWTTIIISVSLITAWKIKEKGKKNGLNKGKRESL